MTGGKSSQSWIVQESLLDAGFVVLESFESSENDVACARNVLVV